MLVSLSLSSILYHYTPLNNMVNILKNDEFVLASPLQAQSEGEISPLFYLSTTRHRLGGYHLTKEKRGQCLIELDGRKLSSRVKGKSTDYWQSSYPNESERAQYNESEDRLLSKKPTIPKAKSYIRKVDLLFPDGLTQHKDDVIKVRFIIAACKKAGIEINIYQNHKDFLISDKRNLIPLRSFYVKNDLMTKKQKQNELKDMHNITTYLELFAKKDYLSLSKKAKSYVREYLIYGRKEAVSELRPTLSDDVKLAAGNPRTGIRSERERLNKLTQIMIKRKWTQVDFIVHLADKWEEIYKKL